jgi:hypothetical protein
MLAEGITRIPVVGDDGTAIGYATVAAITALIAPQGSSATTAATP